MHIFDISGINKSKLLAALYINAVVVPGNIAILPMKQAPVSSPSSSLIIRGIEKMLFSIPENTAIPPNDEEAPFSDEETTPSFVGSLKNLPSEPLRPTQPRYSFFKDTVDSLDNNNFILKKAENLIEESDDLYFDFIDLGKGPRRLDIDLSDDIFDSSNYADMYGSNRTKEIIEQLREMEDEPKHEERVNATSAIKI